MKDIDFDELDRAVSSVLSPDTPTPVATSTSSSDASQNSPSQLATSLTSVATPTSLPATPPREEAPVSVPARSTVDPTTSIVSRKGGRFMDVVPATGNTQKNASTAVPSKVGKVLQPTGTVAIAPNENIAAPSGTLVSSPPMPTATWPDPLEVNGFNSKKVAETSSQPPASNAGTPAVTPFLDDPKVEKRPLGAFSDNTAVSSDDTAINSEDAFATRLDASKVELEPEKPLRPSFVPPKPQQVEKVPPELERDIVAIEADASPDEHEKVSASVDPAKSTPQPLMTAETVVSSASSMSIPQQYQEVPQDNTPGQHPLFDTKEYHPPIAAHPGSTHHNAIIWVIVALLLLIATAAGFGYWLYTQV